MELSILEHCSLLSFETLDCSDKYSMQTLLLQVMQEMLLISKTSDIS